MCWLIGTIAGRVFIVKKTVIIAIMLTSTNTITIQLIFSGYQQSSILPCIANM